MSESVFVSVCVCVLGWVLTTARKVLLSPDRDASSATMLRPRISPLCLDHSVCVATVM